MQKLAILLTTLFAFFLIWVIYLANTGQHSVFFDFVQTVPYGDKIGHVLLFGFLTLGSVIASGFRTISKTKIYWGSAAVLAFVLIEEASQYFIPSRTMDIQDALADVLGIALFSVFAYGLNRFQKSLCRT